MSNGSLTKSRWLARATLAVVAITAAATVSLPDASGAANPHRAAVIVETGADTHRVVITFTEDSITGIEALRRAGADPVVYGFAGQGGAVCRLFGVGRDSGPNCLGGQDGDNRYWAYFRAPAGTSSFKYSQIGGGTAQVRDGDVEGWRFSTGQAPMYVSLGSLLPPPPPPAEPPGGVVPVPPLGGVGNGSGSGSSGAPPGAAIGPSGAGAPTNRSRSTLPDTGTTAPTGANGKDRSVTASGDGSGAERAGDRADARRAQETETALAVSSSDDDGGSSALSLLWLALLLVAIAVAIVVVRRVRRAHTPAP